MITSKFFPILRFNVLSTPSSVVNPSWVMVFFVAPFRNSSNLLTVPETEFGCTLIAFTCRKPSLVFRSTGPTPSFVVRFVKSTTT